MPAENAFGLRVFAWAGDDLRQSARGGARVRLVPMWQPIATAPFDSDLELAVIDESGPHALVFPCRRILGGWIKTETRQRLEVRPTHWRKWEAERENGLNGRSAAPA